MVDIFVPAWMRGTELENVYREAMVARNFDAQLALEDVRAHGSYDSYFPGNRRDDGTLIHTEGDYFSLIENYEDTLLSIGINPDLFSDKFPDLISGYVSAPEFATRVNSLYERVLTASQQIQDAYATEFSFDMTTEAIVASFLDPDVGQAILSRQISLSEVMGEAASRNFNIARDVAEQYVNFGVDTVQEAQRYFADAESMVPTLSVLAARHDDPDDDFDLEEFSSAALFGDPTQRRRMRRLMAQERASFGSDRGLTVRRNQSGSLTGLQQQ